MAPVDPTYPLYPIFGIVTAVMLLLVLSTKLARRSWNFGLCFLCFWLFWVNLFNGIDAVVWADNADIKLLVYCDVVSHVQIFSLVVKPACSLIITRRLYKIASLKSVSKRERRFDIAFDWLLGAGLPAFVVGVLYYINQGARFLISEGYGCSSYSSGGGIDVIVLYSWQILFPLITIFFYYPKIIYTFYRHRRDVHDFLQSDDTGESVRRATYLRILALASIDLLVTLPIGIMGAVADLENVLPGARLVFYEGWDKVHPSTWGPIAVTYEQQLAGGFWNSFRLYFQRCTSPFLAIVIFALFGLTSEARATYWRGVCTVLRLFGWKPKTIEQGDTEDMKFGVLEDGGPQLLTHTSSSLFTSNLDTRSTVEDAERGQEKYTV